MSDKIITYEDLKEIPTPKETESYKPVPHHYAVDMVQDIAEGVLRGFECVSHTFTLARENNQFFGALHFDAGDPDTRLTIGFRNSLDKSLAFGLCAGHQVIVCSNMMFIGEIVIHRKHTGDILKDLEVLIFKVARRSYDTYRSSLEAVESFKVVPISEIFGYQLVGEMWGKKIITNSQASVMMREWKKPSYEQFQPRNLYSLYNAGTFALKGAHPTKAMRIHRKFHDAMSEVYQEMQEPDEMDEDGKVIANDPVDDGMIDNEPQV